MESKYLIQIHKSKLEDYIAKAIIAPDIYFENEIEIDTQSQMSDILLLSNGYINPLTPNQILIKVMLTLDETNSLTEVTPHIFILDTPLPITRIKQIYTSSRDTTNTILNSLLSKQSGYIAKTLFRVFPKGKKKFQQYMIKPISYNSKDYTKELLQYDQIMGLFAFIKNTNLYYTNESHIYINYPKSYFEIYNNNSIELDTWLEKQLSLSQSLLAKKLIERITKGEHINEKFIKEITDFVENDEVKEQFQLLLETSLEYKSVLKYFEDRELIYFLITLLFIYSKKHSSDRYVLKKNIIEEIPQERAEISLALLGLYYGYTIISAYEDIKFEDDLFDKLQKNYNMKFRLDSALEYNLIEAIYKQVFKLDYDVPSPTLKRYKNITISRTKAFNTHYKVEKKRYIDVDSITISTNDKLP
ncbi:MAG: hypothetical protein QM493_05895 [Sulfurovum sp.]